MNKERKTYINTNETIFNPVWTASILNASDRNVVRETRKLACMRIVRTIIFVCLYFCDKIGDF